MATKCSRIINRTSISSLKSAFKKAPSPACTPPTSSFSRIPASAPSTPRRFSLFSRIPSELGAVQSMLPLHSTVAAARLTSCLSTTSRSCRALSQGTLCCTSPDL
ncbi:OLC1v1031802C1 [Oldenlandia corymbosa var. corymbosa]|uniref:OLC1v1031802C1 n=1 Tax=Oldenlandia corymbosa var. corymbosa TaxID=529605 RepID=A0AAV1CMK4_OLDCO|nr:OLC1v1031802C1 [Oldenlandia corymbosa var. corymbosa]